MDTNLPATPPEEDQRDACCGVCGSIWHLTTEHPPTLAGVAPIGGVGAAVDDFPPGYDPAEADRLIGRDPHAANPQ